MHRRSLLERSLALGLLAPALPAHSQAQKTAFIVSGFPAGGMGDHVARPLAEKLRGVYAQNVVVDSKVGAGGRIAVDYVKRAAPDGSTILQIPSSPMTLYPHTYRKLGYEPLADFVPVASTVSYAFVLTAGPGVPDDVRTLAQYVQRVQAHPRLASYGVPAAGSALHFVGMMLGARLGGSYTAVPYKGGAPLLNDVLGGQIPVSISVLGEVMPYIRSGRLRGLAVSSPVRSRFLPEIPTFVEQGYDDIAVEEWLGWFVPAKTPADTVTRLNERVGQGLQDPQLIDALAASGLQPLHQTPAEFAQRVRTDFDRWGPIVKASGFTAED